MNIRKMILNKIKSKGYVTTRDIKESTGLTRQGVHKHIKQLITDKKIKKIGNTKGVKYILQKEKEFDLSFKVERYYSLSGLKEDKVFNRLSLQYNFKNQLQKNVFDILSYSFTEILNNAIDHSESEKTKIKLRIDDYKIIFSIDDWGIGIFENIKKKFSLEDEYEALQELIKGKTTTARKQHSGEGLFFTSKVADKLVIRSHNIEVIFDNKKDDLFTKKTKFKEGTKVDFFIAKNSKKKLGEIFEKYSGKEYDYKFSKTSVTVNIFTDKKRFYASRSEAKRLLYNLTNFKEIILNFKGVKGIGQGFADEIFRVFKEKHPDIKIIPTNTNQAVETMIKHVN